MHVVGVDEAGKGPVLGSMFAAAVCVPAGEDPAAGVQPPAIEAGVLPEGIDDSKRIAPERREALAGTIRESEGITVGVAEITVDRIDDSDTDMNSLTVAAHAEAIAAAIGTDGFEGHTELTAVVDAGDTSESRFASRVAEATTADCAVHAEHGADESYPLVGAASIVAKVERDAHVARLAERHGEVGSGYPSDGTTRTFLREFVRENGRLPACARRSWSTSRDVLAAAEQSGLDDF